MDAPVGMDAPEATAGYVLVVEDNLVSQRVAAAMLEKLGLAVTVASDGREAVAQVQRRRPSLVLMDCQMPEMDGFAATRAIREAEGDAARLTIVAMTAFALPGDRERCIAAGMDDYVAKPLTLAGLARLVERWLGRTRAVNPAAPATEEAVSLAHWQTLEEELGLEELGELLAVLRRQVPATLVEMRGRLAAGDLEGVGRLAHKLCGATGDLGAHGLSRRLRAVEEACRTQGAAAPNAQTMTQLEDSYAEAEAFFAARMR